MTAAASAAARSVRGGLVIGNPRTDAATRLRRGGHELGRRAVELLLAGQPPAGVERVPMPLRARASVGPPRGSVALPRGQ